MKPLLDPPRPPVPPTQAQINADAVGYCDDRNWGMIVLDQLGNPLNVGAESGYSLAGPDAAVPYVPEGVHMLSGTMYIMVDGRTVKVFQLHPYLRPVRGFGPGLKLVGTHVVYDSVWTGAPWRRSEVGPIHWQVARDEDIDHWIAPADPRARCHSLNALPRRWHREVIDGTPPIRGQGFQSSPS